MCDREELIRELKGTCEKEGKFICLLGGKSFGKSKCLNTLAKEANQGIAFFPNYEENRNNAPLSGNKEMLVLVVDMRAQGDKSILSGLIKAINHYNGPYSDLPKQIAKHCLIALTDNYGKPFNLSGKSVENAFNEMESSLSPKDRIDLTQTLIQELFQKMKLTIIVDEANSAFDRSLLNQEQLLQAQADLALLTRLTKQERQVFAMIPFFLLFFLICYF